MLRNFTHSILSTRITKFFAAPCTGNATGDRVSPYLRQIVCTFGKIAKKIRCRRRRRQSVQCRLRFQFGGEAETVEGRSRLGVRDFANRLTDDGLRKTADSDDRLKSISAASAAADETRQAPRPLLLSTFSLFPSAAFQPNFFFFFFSSAAAISISSPPRPDAASRRHSSFTAHNNTGLGCAVCDSG